ncbi:MAG: peptidase S10, partial [Xanthobacteraceae bacterium]|nr:peptidase S10 [Xanthobacteraceae bacterium]
MKTNQLWLVLSVALATAVLSDSATLAQAPAATTPPAAPAATNQPAPPPAAVAPASPPAAAPAAATPAARPDARRSQAARLPGEITTIQYLEIPDRRFQFKATAGAIPLYDASDGSLQAEVAYVAYVKSEAEPVRPITFVFNGGPGSSSAYLQLGAMGPWLLSLDH